MKIQLLAVSLGIAVLVSACGGGDKKKTPPPKPNTSPTAMSASVTTQADTPLNGKLMGSDADKDMLTYTVAAQPTQGMLTVQTDGSYTYTPNTDVVGMDQFSFTVSDGKAISPAAMVNITIDLLAVDMSAYTRKAFNQMESDTPLSLNSRTVTQDVTDETAFDDLLMQ
ncbi:MAG: cadherin-like domain-containing protein [Alphaproteobacteria bacterium]|nr:cadherin-like domain-containing protein [Alphaproteobacteria bacterium]